MMCPAPPRPAVEGNPKGLPFLAGITLLAIALVPALPDVRQGRVLEPRDYGRWEQLVAQPTPLSPDGRWLVYRITRTNGQHELRVQPAAGGEVTALPFGEQPAFSDDSKWLAYLIGFSEEEEARLRKDKKPVHKHLGLLELATGRKVVVDGVESFALSASGTHVAMRRYAPPMSPPSPIRVFRPTCRRNSWR